MVFEHLLPEAVLERKAWTGFFLAFVYALLAIVIARLLFAANSGIVSVVFVSIFLLPYFSTLLKREERQERSDYKKGFLGLLQDNKDVFLTYLGIFAGIYLAYMLYSFTMGLFNVDLGVVYREQLGLEGVRGGATFSAGLLVDILLNNWWVLLACFLVALVAGDGSVFFVAWNASVWGTVFGYRALAAGFSGESALFALLIIFVITLPHVLLEGFAYILAAVAGGVLSDEIVEKSAEVRLFVAYLLVAAVLYVVFSILLRALFPAGMVRGLGYVVAALGLLFCMRFVFSSERERSVFTYNLQVFCLAIGVFLFGAIVETFVLLNAMPLRAVYLAAG